MIVLFWNNRTSWSVNYLISRIDLVYLPFENMCEALLYLASASLNSAIKIICIYENIIIIIINMYIILYTYTCISIKALVQCYFYIIAT